MYIVISSALFSCMGAFVKMASSTLPNEMIVFFRNAFGVLFLLPFISRHGWQGLRTNFFFLHFVRAISGLLAMYCFFYVISRMRLAEAVLLNYTMPLFIPVIASVWLKEQMSPKIWWGILIGFVGVLFILRPGRGLYNMIAVAGLAAGILAAFAQVAVRRLTKTESTIRIVFYFAFISLIVAFIPMIRVWVIPEPRVWVYLAMVGLLATIAQLFLTKAFSCAPAAQVGPFIYAAVVFSGFIDWGVWKVLPDLFFLLGAVLICMAGVLTIRLVGQTVSMVSEKEID